MAAGRPRKSYSNRSYEESYSYKNRFDQRYGLDRPGFKSSGGRISEHGRNDGGHGWRLPPSVQKLQDKKREVENGSLSGGSTKKRKFSPIVWNDVEKQVKLSSENRTCSNGSEITNVSSSKSYEDVGRIERRSVSAESELLQIPTSSVESLATTTPKQHEQEKNEDGEHIEQRNLSKSKWAFKDSPKIEPDTNSSLESGEFKLEGSEMNDEVSSLSSDDSHFVAPSVENVDDYSSPESDNDLIPVLPTMIPSCRNVFEFERLGKISEGTYGVVHKARDTKTGEIVALKKVKLGKERDGFPVAALREINILGMLQHPSLVEMKEVVMDDFNGVYMVMEYVDNELKGYMERVKQPFSQSEVKRLMIDLLEGVSYLHDNYVMHRDLKTSNLLLNNDGELKICDFGMARQYASPLKPYTSLVVTLWYRAPELLLGLKNYSTAVDMWSVGCIMAELLSKKPLFDGCKELEQIDKIFKTLGTPNDSIWPGYSKLPGVKSSFVKQPYNLLRKRFPVATFTGSPVLTESGFDLLNKLLTYDPEKRITAEEALNHGWFCEAPLPAERVRICKQRKPNNLVSLWCELAASHSSRRPRLPPSGER